MALRARQKEREEVLNQFGRAQGVWIFLTSTLDPGIMTPGDSRTTSIVDAARFYTNRYLAAARRVDRAAFGKEGDFGPAHQALLKALDRAEEFL
jgi:hypothetical protein